MARPKNGVAAIKVRTTLQREADLAVCAKRIAQGWTATQIHDEITSLRPYSLHFVTVWKDCKEVLNRWRLESFHEIEEERMRHLLKLEELERIGWLWLEGKTEAEIKEVYEEAVTPFGAETRKKVETLGALRNVDRGIALLKWAMEERAKILGFYVSTNSKVQIALGPNGQGAPGEAAPAALTITINSERSTEELTRFPVVDAEVVDASEAAEVTFNG